MFKKSNFDVVIRFFIKKHNELFSRDEPPFPGLICETIIEMIARADFYNFQQVSRKRLFRACYLLTKCMRYSELQVYRLMSNYADDVSVVDALERNDWKFFVNLFDIISMGYRVNGDVCAFLFRDWHEGSTVRIPGSGHHMW